MFDNLIPLLVVIVVSGLALVGGLGLLRLVIGLRVKAGNPTVQAVLDALEKYIYMAILAGEKGIISAENQVDVALQGQDKKKIADSFYDLLPDFLLVDGIPLPISFVKSFVPRDVFEARVKDAYDSAHAFIMKNQAWLASQVDAIVPPDTTVPSMG